MPEMRGGVPGREHNGGRGMKLTETEREICNTYGRQDETGHVQCDRCPLNLAGEPEFFGLGPLACYATIDGRTRIAKGLKRLLEYTEEDLRNEA